jgi:hypothetical protein
VENYTEIYFLQGGTCGARVRFSSSWQVEANAKRKTMEKQMNRKSFILVGLAIEVTFPFTFTLLRPTII